MNSEKNGIRDPSVNRSIVSMKNCGNSLKKHVRSIFGFTPVEVESQGVFRDFFPVDKTGIGKTLQHRLVKTARFTDRILTRDVTDALDVILLDVIEEEHHAVIDHLGDVCEHSAVDKDLSFFEGPLIDTVCAGLGHIKAIDCTLYNKYCVFGYNKLQMQL